MRHSSAPATPLFAEGGIGTLRLLAYLGLAVVLMVSDHRGGHLQQLRRALSALNEPLYYLASAPQRLARGVYDSLVDHRSLVEERDRLRNELLIASAQLARLDAVHVENQRLRALLGGTRGLGMQVRLASLADFDLDPFRHRATLDIGERDGVTVGAALIDSGGVYGQVIAVTPLHSTVLLVSDPAHAVPVQVQRSGVRMIAYGTGDIDRLHIPNIPQSADIREGDTLVTSGLGGRFPAGLPVGRIVSLRSDDTRLFIVADAHPSALLDRGRDLLLVWNSEPAIVGEVGPPVELASPPAPAATGTPP